MQILWGAIGGFPKKDFTVDGFTNGFMIKFEVEKDSFEANNSKAAWLNPVAVPDKIRKEVEAGHIAGPFDETPFENIRCSPLSIKEKSTAGPSSTGYYTIYLTLQ